VNITIVTTKDVKKVQTSCLLCSFEGDRE